MYEEWMYDWMNECMIEWTNEWIAIQTLGM